MADTEETKPIIRMYHVIKRYGAKAALNDISLEIPEKELVFITGPSGAGKSTLLRMMYLGERPSEGQIVIDGVNLSRISRRRIIEIRRKFGIIFQDYKLITTRNVFDNVALVAEAIGTQGKLVKKKVMSVLRTVGMEDKANAYPPSLSGGEQQRVAVARAIVGDPRIIVADEPTASLDAEAGKIIFDLLKSYHQRGTTLVVATHDTALIRKTGGRVVILQNGCLDVCTTIPKMPA